LWSRRLAHPNSRSVTDWDHLKWVGDLSVIVFSKVIGLLLGV